jgi:hypothetical protein
MWGAWQSSVSSVAAAGGGCGGGVTADNRFSCRVSAAQHIYLQAGRQQQTTAEIIIISSRWTTRITWHCQAVVLPSSTSGMPIVFVFCEVMPSTLL